jgi:hypothetical protein
VREPKLRRVVHQGKHVQLTRPKHHENGTAAGPTFADLVYAHHGSRASPNGHRPDAEELYRRTLKRFQTTHGEVVSAYWCSHIESGVALTEKPRRFPFRPRVAFHRETDWATKRAPDIAAELHRLDELAIRSRTVLSGVRRAICLHLIASCAAHLLSLADAAAAPESPAELDAALAEEKDRIDEVERYYCEAANGQAQIVYVGGMATVAVLVSLLGGLFLWHYDGFQVGVVAAVAGSVGAVVSVIQRITNQSFQVDYDIGRPYAFFLGGLRPMIGAALAIAITYVFASGILHLPLASPSSHNEHLALVVVGFLAGFSERWAQDTLATALPDQGAPRPRKA